MEAICQLQHDVDKIKQVLLQISQLQPNIQSIKRIPTGDFNMESIITNTGKMLESFLSNQQSIVTQPHQWCQEQIQQLNEGSINQALQIKTIQDKMIREQNLTTRMQQDIIKHVNLKFSERFVNMADRQQLLLQEHIDQATQLNEKALLAQQQLLTRVDKIASDINVLNLVMSQKANTLDLNVLEQGLQHYLNQHDLECIQKEISNNSKSLTSSYCRLEQDIIRLKQMINQQDYTILLKASKMDYELLCGQLKEIEKSMNLANQQSQVALDTLNQDQVELKNKFYEFHLTIKSEIGEFISVKGMQLIEDQIKIALKKHDLGKILVECHKLSLGLEAKADQSQFAELMQMKASHAHLQLIQQQCFELKKQIKLFADSSLIFMEAQSMDNHHDSINLKRSDIQKALNQIRQVLIKLQCKEEQKKFNLTQVLEDKSRNYAVKLRPTLYRTQQQVRRIKTEYDQ